MGRMKLMLVVLSIAALLAGGRVRAEDGRDFYGFYETTDILDLGDQVGMTFRLELCNVSRGDVTDATVTLRDPESGSVLAIFSPVSVVYRECVHANGSATVPRLELDSWRHGQSPTLRIEFTDAAGNVVQRPIEIGRRFRSAEEN